MYYNIAILYHLYILFMAYESPEVRQIATYVGFLHISSLIAERNSVERQKPLYLSIKSFLFILWLFRTERQ